MLDAGAGNSPYRSYFRHCTYEATDLCERTERTYEDVTFQCDLSEIPVEDARYDMVLCTQVLEHVPEPQAVICELHRVLKPGGRIWLSTPLFFPEHEVPYDFFRYTQFGLRHIFEKAGFRIEEIDWIGGYFGTVSYQLSQAWRYLPTKPKDCGGGLKGLLIGTAILLTKPWMAATAIMLGKFDLMHRYTDSGHCIDFYIIAEKLEDKLAKNREVAGE